MSTAESAGPRRTSEPGGPVTARPRRRSTPRTASSARIRFASSEDARAYMRRVVPRPRRPEVWFGKPVEDGDRAAIEWWALLVEPNGEKSTIAGCHVIRFGDDGLVAEARDCWAVEPGHLPAAARVGPLARVSALRNRLTAGTSSTTSSIALARGGRAPGRVKRGIGRRCRHLFAGARPERAREDPRAAWSHRRGRSSRRRGRCARRHDRFPQPAGADARCSRRGSAGCVAGRAGAPSGRSGDRASRPEGKPRRRRARGRVRPPATDVLTRVPALSCTAGRSSWLIVVRSVIASYLHTMYRITDPRGAAPFTRRLDFGCAVSYRSYETVSSRQRTISSGCRTTRRSWN